MRLYSHGFALGLTGAILSPLQVRRRPWLLSIFLATCATMHCGLTSAEEAAQPMTCELRSEVNGGYLQLSAIGRSQMAVSGTYALYVSKHSESGDSENAQSGAFSLEPDQERVLTTTFLDSGAVGHYRARLLIKTDSGAISCSSK